MEAFLEILSGGQPALVPLVGDRLALGKASNNDVAIPWDDLVSRSHAVLDRVGGNWSIRDLTSRNGTFVNGGRITADKPLRHGDVVRIGTTNIRFRVQLGDDPHTLTPAADPAPRLTPRERDVLIELCRPMADGSVFTAPASIRQIAERLVVTEAAVRQYLGRLAAKFEIDDEGEQRRLRLANEAFSRGAIDPGDFAGHTR